MIRVQADDELLDVPTMFIFTALNMARAVRPRAVVVSDTYDGPHALPPGETVTLKEGDKVAHWTYPGLTGEVAEIEQEGPRGTRVHWVAWPSQTEPGTTLEPVAYFPDSLIRITKLES